MKVASRLLRTVPLLLLLAGCSSINRELTRERAEELLKRSSLFMPGSPQTTLTTGVNTGEMADAFYSQLQASRTLARLGWVTLKPSKVKGIVPGVSLPGYQVELTPSFRSKAQAGKWEKSALNGVMLVPIAFKTFESVGSIRRVEDQAVVSYTWRWQATPEGEQLKSLGIVEGALVSPYLGTVGTVGKSEARVRRDDDGWQLESSSEPLRR